MAHRVSDTDVANYIKHVRGDKLYEKWLDTVFSNQESVVADANQWLQENKLGITMLGFQNGESDTIIWEMDDVNNDKVLASKVQIRHLRTLKGVIDGVLSLF
jgi:hypothetical protein